MQQADCVAALAELARIEQVLSKMGSWLDDEGHERAAVLLGGRLARRSARRIRR